MIAKLSPADKPNENPSGGDGNKPAPKAPGSAGVPKTGDESMAALWLALAAVSALGLGYVILRKKKN